MGEEWLSKLKEEKKNFIKCDTIGYYQDKVSDFRKF
jgi:hypothetical protein